MANFHAVALLGKRGETERVRDTLIRLTDFLRRQRIQIYYDPVAAALLDLSEGQVVDYAEMGSRCDLAIVVGGDGTLLGAARALASSALPLLGINLGHLGFLTDISPDGMEVLLERILLGEADTEERFLLSARIDGGEPLLALNDVVIHRWNTARMIALETIIDGRFVNLQHSDGLIIATPTGSTAYALSGGGPLLHPTLEAIALVPICPHTLSNRPLVVRSSSRIEIRVCNHQEDQVHITCDGQMDFALSPGASLRIERYPYPIRLLHPKGHDYYEILRAKLGWGGHLPGRPSC